jgi:hypothetical protein
MEGRSLQDRIDTGLEALEHEAARHGNTIDKACLAIGDLYYLADLPLLFSSARFYEHAFTVKQAQLLARLLDRSTLPRIMNLRAVHG